VIDLEHFKTLFTKKYGRVPRVFRAPGRINLIGEHTDYNEGFVLPAAIDKATYVAASAREDRTITAVSNEYENEVSIDLDNRDAGPRDDWGKYIQGVAMSLESSDYRLVGADFLIASDIQRGAGLSSSAALEVSVGRALTSIAGQNIDGMSLARICQTAEHQYAGVLSGIMDQFASVHGVANNALFLNCRNLEWSAIPLAGATFVICDTKTKHDLAAGEYNKRRSECSEAARLFGNASLRDVSIPDLETLPSDAPANLRKRARHVVTENKRVIDAVEALKAVDMKELGSIINASHESLRDDFEVSCPELDEMVAIARRVPGLLGARMMGGGFGGCTINLLAPESVKTFISNVYAEYRDVTGIEPEIFPVKVAAGAGEIF
jgi:galactokinase